MSSRLIALLFEYTTLNGGERSLLAALDWLRVNDRLLEFVAIAPATGRLADALRERGIPLMDWTLADSDGRRLSQASIDASLMQIVRSLRPALIHANSLAMGRLSGRLARHFEIPTTTHLRDIVKLSATAIADLNCHRKLLAVSTATRHFHVAQGLDADRTIVVHNGIDLNLFQPRPATGYLHAELRLPSRSLSDNHPQSQLDSPIRPAKLVATIGQIGLRKGQDVLAAAAPLISEQVPDAHFLFVGERTSQKGESVEFEQALYRTFAENQIADRLHHLGVRDDVPYLLNEISLLIHPANQEPYGRVLLEATSAGVPIVATNVGGTSEIVVDGLTGRLVPPHHPRALADAAIELLTNDQLIARNRAAARERAVHHFAISQSAKRLQEVWYELL